MTRLPGPIRRIAVFRALVIGDMLCAVPALRALRARFPEAEVTLIGLPWAQQFVNRFDNYLDRFLEFPGFAGLPERPLDALAWPEFLHRVQSQKFDLALQIHGSGDIVNPLVQLFAARITAGFFLPGQYCPSPQTFMPYPDDLPESDRHLRLMEFLGIPAQGRHLEWPLCEQDRRELAALPEAQAIDGAPYVCLHPGARFLSRRWRTDRFAAVGDALYRTGRQVVITGTESEAPLARQVAEAMQAPAINLAGRTSLGAMAALVAGCSLLVCNDTGVSHLAAAVGAPSVVVVTGSDPARWAPIDRCKHRVVMAPISCRPCADPVCPIGVACGDLVEARQVIDCALAQLEKFAESPASAPRSSPCAV